MVDRKLGYRSAQSRHSLHALRAVIVMAGNANTGFLGFLGQHFYALTGALGAVEFIPDQRFGFIRAFCVCSPKIVAVGSQILELALPWRMIHHGDQSQRAFFNEIA